MNDKTLENALTMFCDFVNQFNDDHDPASQYTPESFLVRDPARNLYGNTKLLHTIDNGDYSPTLYVFLADCGDDGGPSTLFVWADPLTGALEHMSYLFDTQMCDVAYTDALTGKLVMRKGAD